MALFGISMLSNVQHALSQCHPDWAQGEAIVGVDGEVRAAANWVDTLQGQPIRYVALGGVFRVAGEAQCANLVLYDPANRRFSSPGQVNGTVHALAHSPFDGLVVGGTFGSINGATFSGVARWNGYAWSPLSSGVAGSVRSLLVLPNSVAVVAGGNFVLAGGTPAYGVAIWDGLSGTWRNLGSGLHKTVGLATAYALARMTNGDLIVAGDFETAGGISASHIARWDGSRWWPLGTGMDGPITCLTRLPNGDIVAGGNFHVAGGRLSHHVARWDGVAWWPLTHPQAAPGMGLDGPSAALMTTSNGDLLVGGRFATAGRSPASNIARWTGTDWLPMGTGASIDSGSASVASILELPDGRVVVGGRFSAAGGQPAWNVAIWAQSQWAQLGQGRYSGGTALCMARLENGDMMVGGTFGSAGGVTVNNIGRLSNGTWTPLGTGVTGGPTPVVRAIAVRQDGRVIAGGIFDTAGGRTANNIAEWDGLTWSPLGMGLQGGAFPMVSSIVVLPSGNIVVGGSFTTAGGIAANNVALWNGTAWAPMGSGTDEAVKTLAVLRNGTLLAGGVFATAGGVAASGIASWNGTAWSSLGPGVSGTVPWVNCILALPNNEAIVGGTFAAAGGLMGTNRIARWDGAAWHAIGTAFALPHTSNAPYSSVNAVVSLPDGDLLAVGDFFMPSQSIQHCARWYGTYWGGISSAAGLGSIANAALWSPSGEVFIAGGFLTAGDSVSAMIASLATPCRALTESPGNGCPGIAGNITLTPSPLPWIGGTGISVGSGLPVGSLVFGLMGVHSNWLPLRTLLPQAAPDCTLLVSPDSTSLHVGTSSTLALRVDVPDIASLIGVQYHQQLIALQTSSAGAVTSVAASNSLRLTVGSY